MSDGRELLELVVPLGPEKKAENDVFYLDFQPVEKFFRMKHAVFYQDRPQFFQPGVLSVKTERLVQLFPRDHARFQEGLPDPVTGVRRGGKNDLAVLDIDAFYEAAPAQGQSSRGFSLTQVFEDIRERR